MPRAAACRVSCRCWGPDSLDGRSPMTQPANHGDDYPAKPIKSSWPAAGRRLGESCPVLFAEDGRGKARNRRPS